MGAAEAAWKQRVSAQRQREGDAVITVQAPSPPERRQNASRGGGGAASEGVTARPPPPVAEGAPGDEEEGRAGSPSTPPAPSAAPGDEEEGRAGSPSTPPAPSAAPMPAELLDSPKLSPSQPLGGPIYALAGHSAGDLTQAIHAFPPAPDSPGGGGGGDDGGGDGGGSDGGAGVGRAAAPAPGSHAVRSLADTNGWNELGSPDVPPASNLPFPPSRSDLGFSPTFSPEPGRASGDGGASEALDSPPPDGGAAAAGGGGSGGGKAASSSTTSSFGEDSFRSPPVVVPDDDDDDVGERGGEDDEDEDGPAAWSAVSVVVIDFSGIPSMDTTALRMLEDVRRELQTRGLKLLLSGCHGAARDLLVRANFFDALGMENVFLRVDGAVARACALAGTQEPSSGTPDSPMESGMIGPAGRRLQRSLTPQAKWTHSMVSNHWARQGLLSRHSGDHGKALL